MCNLGAIGFHGVLPGAPVSTLLAPRMAPKRRGSRRSADIRLGWPSPGALLAPESVAADDTFEAHVRKLVPAFAAPPFPLPSRLRFHSGPERSRACPLTARTAVRQWRTRERGRERARVRSSEAARLSRAHGALAGSGWKNPARGTSAFRAMT